MRAARYGRKRFPKIDVLKLSAGAVPVTNSCEGCFFYDDKAKNWCERANKRKISVSIMLIDPNLCGPERKMYLSPMEI